jgi:murein DD-endopeptidase MepM/ murein hydrolase activator NlpD
VAVGELAAPTGRRRARQESAAPPEAARAGAARRLERVEAAEREAAAALQARRADLDRLAVRVVPSPGPFAAVLDRGSPGVTFPVAGPWEFHDDWGDPRSGGRRHRGTDIWSPLGSPVVAVEDGVARTANEDLGGTVVYLNGRSGTLYYYAHLSAVAARVLGAGAGTPVAAGEVLGRVGNSGNAAGGPTHLHFQVGEGADWVNPYPLLAALSNGVMDARARQAVLPTASTAPPAPPQAAATATAPGAASPGAGDGA